MANKIYRIALSLILLLSVLFSPVYISLALALIGIVYFSYYVEAIVLLLVSDLLYGVGEVRYYNSPFLTLLIVTVVFVLIELLKRQLKFTKNDLK